MLPKHRNPEQMARHGLRSATEAFLFRRLQTLEATAGRFQLNIELPIPFNTKGKMEVDFLCESARLVIELDGAQHLADPEAYRRDRRKDVALQERGYFVLRFLAEDVGKHLDDVLDGILRELAHQSRNPARFSQFAGTNKKAETLVSAFL